MAYEFTEDETLDARRSLELIGLVGQAAVHGPRGVLLPVVDGVYERGFDTDSGRMYLQYDAAAVEAETPPTTQLAEVVGKLPKRYAIPQRYAALRVTYAGLITIFDQSDTLEPCRGVPSGPHDRYQLTVVHDEDSALNGLAVVIDRWGEVHRDHNLGSSRFEDYLPPGILNEQDATELMNCISYAAGIEH